LILTPGSNSLSGLFSYLWGEIFRDIDVTQGLENFERPVFLALGRHDFLVAPPSSWVPIRGRFQDVTVRFFENSGHTPHCGHVYRQFGQAGTKGDEREADDILWRVPRLDAPSTSIVPAIMSNAKPATRRTNIITRLRL
jgi:hypothetical protein